VISLKAVREKPGEDGSHHGKMEEGIRPIDREREREYEPERKGMEMGI
jgi:hypothetical protein